jgi:hypothetical protein
MLGYKYSEGRWPRRTRNAPQVTNALLPMSAKGCGLPHPAAGLLLRHLGEVTTQQHLKRHDDVMPQLLMMPGCA